MHCDKKRHSTYAEALAALDKLLGAKEDIFGAPVGSIYQCDRCSGWHISSRRFVLAKNRGRGKVRRRVRRRIS